MSTPTAKPAAKKAAAATQETKPTPRTIAFRGLDITVPPTSDWGSEIYFLLEELDEAAGPASLRVITRMTKELIGEDQFNVVRGKLRSDGVKVAEVEDTLVELFKLVFEGAGMTVGESDASPSS